MCPPAACHAAAAAAGSNRGRATLSRQTSFALWICFLCLAQTACGAPPRYQPRLWNRSCNYSVSIPAQVFFNRSSSMDDVLFPLSPGYRRPVPDDQQHILASVQLSCFGPGQRINHTLVAAGLKMPCAYTVTQSGYVDYWEEAACEVSLRSNCYCYAIGKQNNQGYCIPGYTTVGTLDVNHSTCADPIRKVALDGGRRATREEVYAAKQPAKGHWIAMVVWPGVDFHFFRRDAEGWWSQKRGDTFVTNTYPNGSVVLDVEDPAILGAYNHFCGYFHVDPDSHAKTDSTWTYSSVPKRLKALAQHRGYQVSSTPLPQPSTGWMRLNYPYLLFGLNAAVFESGSRRLPWQTTGSLPVVKEAGSSRKAPAVASSFSYTANPTDRIRMDAQTLGPHWMSHAQHRTTSQERDHAIRKQYESMIISRT